MSRLESEHFITPETPINVENNSRLVPRPLESRREALAEFDAETKVQQAYDAPANFSKETATYLINANLLLNNGETGLALNLYRAILMRDSKNIPAMCGMAECLGRNGDFTEAAKYLRIAHQFDPRPVSAARLADALYELGVYEDARGYYLEALRMGLVDGEELFRTYKNLGNISTLQSDLAAAEEFYNKAYTLNPDSDVLMVNYGSLEIQRGDLNKAVEKFRHAVALNGNNDKAWVGLALIHREFGDAELAWANLDRALDANQLNETAMRLVAEWAIKDNEIERACRRLEEFVSHRAQDAHMTMWLAKFLYLSGRLEQAEIEINKALDIDPQLEGAAEVLSVISAERIC
jgi:tetratricopeptide (TPR) repeat protein